MDFPRFSGGDPTEWLYKVNKFFAYHDIAETHKLNLAMLHLDGDACKWLQWMENNGQIRSWVEFELQIKIRFGPTVFDDPNSKLSKLTQIGMVAEYEVQFQDLSF